VSSKAATSLSQQHETPAATAARVEHHTHSDSGKQIQEWRGRTNENLWRVFHGAAKDALRLLPDSSVDCVVTSPPYFWLRDYKVEGQIGLEDSVDGYVVAITDVMTEVFRVLSERGVVFLNLGDTYYSGKGESQGKDRKSAKRRFGLRAVDRSGGLGISLQRKSIIGVPWRVAMKMCQQNWILRSPIIWHRMKGLPEAVRDRPRRAYEYVFMFVKSRHYYFNRDALKTDGGSEDLWSIPARPKANGQLETAPFPDELVERCLEVGCVANGTVLDPFCGSGTTLRVGLSKGSDVIGIDLSEKFCDYTVQLLRDLK